VQDALESEAVAAPLHDTALAERVENFLRGVRDDAVRVAAMAPLAGGACQDMHRVELATSRGTERLVLRSDARLPLPASLGRREEYAVVEAARGAGVPTPAVRYLTEGLVRTGAWAYFMDWAEGEAIGRRVVRAPELADARRRLPEELAQALARVHTITPRTHPALSLRQAVGGPVHGGLAFVRGMLDTLREPHPALEYAFRWLGEHPPPDAETCLLHGDFRTGNFLVTRNGLSAVLDWEFARWGTPAEDIGWLCVRDWRFGQNAFPAGGLASREAFRDAYAAASGVHLSLRALHWWEVMGNVRWAAGSVHQGERYLSGEESDLEYVAIARRAPEMEWEALRLLEQGG
jgi:aminoglycoside phosphotransferase (APT) family kinase protein